MCRLVAPKAVKTSVLCDDAFAGTGLVAAFHALSVCHKEISPSYGRVSNVLDL